MRCKLSAPVIAYSILCMGACSATSAAAPDDRLVEAVKSGSYAQVEALLIARVPVDSAEGDGTTALHWAVYDDDLELAAMLLKAHADPHAATRLDGTTPLWMASQNGNAAMIRLLLSHGADPNEANAIGTAPLMMAAASGSVDAVRELVEHGAQVNAREQAHEQTPLMFAANKNRTQAIQYLIAHGADPNLASKVVILPKIEFAQNGKVVYPGDGAHNQSAEKKDVSQPESEANSGSNAKASDKTAAAADTDEAKKKMHRDHAAKQMGGMTPLLYAARQGNIAAAAALIDGGADINHSSGSEHTTPLVLAIANGHYDLAKMLVDRNADVNKANDMGLTPLYATVDVQWAPHEWSPEPVVAQESTDYLALMKLLIAHGANLNARLGRVLWFRVLSENRNWTDPAGSTAFWRAAQADDVAAMKLLKDAGADTSIPSSNGTTPLMVATGLGWAANYSTTAPTRMEAVQYCLSLGQSLNQQDGLGFTALHGAAFVGDLKLIQYLVDRGARTDLKNKAGDTVADAANGLFEKSLPNSEAVALLEKLGSPNSHNCRSSDCVPPVKEDKKPVAVAATETKKAAGNQ
jgi:ankyrin repeat protein